MLTDAEATQIAKDSVFEAGGDPAKEGDPTLNQDGLVTGHQRDSFQRKVAINTKKHGHKVLNVGAVPNKANTKRAEVVAFLQKEENVVELP